MRSFFHALKSCLAYYGKTQRQHRRQLQEGLDMLATWCSPEEWTRESRRLWDTHSIVAVQAYEGDSPLWESSHISFFSQLGLEQFVSVWCELLNVQHSGMANNENEARQLIRWCHIDNVAFWQAAKPFIDNKFAFLWHSIISESVCIGNMQALLAAGEERLEEFALKQCSLAHSHAWFSLDWIPAHPSVAVYFVEQGWWPRSVLPDVAKQGTLFGKKRAMGAGPCSPFVSPHYLSTWASAMLELMGMSEAEKAFFLINFLRNFGLSCWTTFMQQQCTKQIEGVHVDIAMALAGVSLTQAKALSNASIYISDALYEALGAMSNTLDGDAFLLESQKANYPALQLFLQNQPITSMEQLYTTVIALKNAENGVYSEQYSLP